MDKMEINLDNGDRYIIEKLENGLLVTKCTGCTENIEVNTRVGTRFSPNDNLIWIY